MEGGEEEGRVEGRCALLPVIQIGGMARWTDVGNNYGSGAETQGVLLIMAMFDDRRWI